MSNYEEADANLQTLQGYASDEQFLLNRLKEVNQSDVPKVKPRPHPGMKHCEDLYCVKELKQDSEKKYCYTHFKMFEALDRIKNYDLFGDNKDGGRRNPFDKNNNINFEDKSDNYLQLIYKLTGINFKKDDTREILITRLNMYKKRY